MTTTCTSCDGPVSEAYARVMGDNTNAVTDCPACATPREQSSGFADA